MVLLSEQVALPNKQDGDRRIAPSSGERGIHVILGAHCGVSLLLNPAVLSPLPPPCLLLRPVHEL